MPETMRVVTPPGPTLVLCFKNVPLKDAVLALEAFSKLPGYWASSIEGQGNVTIKATFLKDAVAS